MVAVMRELFEPHPFFRHPEPWFWYDRGSRHLLAAWDRVCSEAIRTEDAERLHAARDSYRTVLLAHLKVLDGYLMLVDGLGDEFDLPPRELHDRLTETREAIQKHHDSLFPRWQTLDDLEAILLERITPSNAELKELAKHYPPPQSWYEETENPITPAE
jgi:hypothetical protein